MVQIEATQDCQILHLSHSWASFDSKVWCVAEYQLECFAMAGVRGTQLDEGPGYCKTGYATGCEVVNPATTV